MDNINKTIPPTMELGGLASYLVQDGLLDRNAAYDAIHHAKQNKTTFTDYLVKSNILSSQTILERCVQHFELPVFDLADFKAEWITESAIKLDLLSYYRVIPLNRDENCLYLGITDPTDHAAIAAIRFHTGLRIRPMLVSESDLDKIIHVYFRTAALDSQLESTLSKILPTEEAASKQETISQDDEPISELVDKLIQDASDKKVSDIHIEPYEQHCRIRFRRNGLLQETAVIPSHLALRITTRLKILANLNIAERRLPQDGRIQIRHPSKMDIRINTCPTLFGEKIVLRMLDDKHINLDIHSLGLTDNQINLLLTKLYQPHGLILVTGPTGSGKTVTLYSALNYLNHIEKNISSVEDPVEIELDGINQVNINPRIGLDFSTVLRTFLRQDPEIIMIGEIRDRDTATIAMQAAQTGHLVLSTLHTNHALDVVTRLQSMGIASYNLISSISLIIAQRLVRKLCPHCKQPETTFTHHTLYRAVGCNHCDQGYQGRIGIFEIISITEKLSQMILAGANVPHLREQAKQDNMTFLWDAALEKVQEGITSFTEIHRVLGDAKQL